MKKPFLLFYREQVKMWNNGDHITMEWKTKGWTNNRSHHTIDRLLEKDYSTKSDIFLMRYIILAHRLVYNNLYKPLESFKE